MTDPLRKNIEGASTQEANINPVDTEQNLSSPEISQNIETPQATLQTEDQLSQENDQQTTIQVAESAPQETQSPESILNNISTVQETDTQKTTELLTDDNKLDPADSNTAHQMLADIINDGKR